MAGIFDPAIFDPVIFDTGADVAAQETPRGGGDSRKKKHRSQAGDPAYELKRRRELEALRAAEKAQDDQKTAADQKAASDEDARQRAQEARRAAEEAARIEAERQAREDDDLLMVLALAA